MHTSTRLASLALLLLLASCASVLTRAPGIRGSWQAESYVLRSGEQYDVAGHIFFADADWTVLFFVTGEDGEPERGSGEGGTYTLEGDQLVFSHTLNLSWGNELPGLPATAPRMAVTDPDAAATEPCRIEHVGDRLTLHFPSGNSMTFAR